MLCGLMHWSRLVVSANWSTLVVSDGSNVLVLSPLGSEDLECSDGSLPSQAALRVGLRVAPWALRLWSALGLGGRLRFQGLTTLWT